MKYIDADKFIEEIEDLKKKYGSIVPKDEVQRCYKGGRIIGYNDALYTINKLQQEQPEVDLGKEIENEWKKCHPTDEGIGLESTIIVNEQFDAIARHFYELGIYARNKDDFKAGADFQYQKDRAEFAKLKAKEWQDGYEAGVEQMTKQGISLNATVITINGRLTLWAPDEIVQPNLGPRVKNGDKVIVQIRREA